MAVCVWHCVNLSILWMVLHTSIYKCGWPHLSLLLLPFILLSCPQLGKAEPFVVAVGVSLWSTLIFRSSDPSNEGPAINSASGYFCPLVCHYWQRVPGLQLFQLFLQMDLVRNICGTMKDLLCSGGLKLFSKCQEPLRFY